MEERDGTCSAGLVSHQSLCLTMAPMPLPWDARLWKASLPSSTATEVSQGHRLQLKLPSVAVRLARQEEAMVASSAGAFCPATCSCAHSMAPFGVPAGADALLSRCRHWAPAVPVHALPLFLWRPELFRQQRLGSPARGDIAALPMVAAAVRAQSSVSGGPRSQPRGLGSRGGPGWPPALPLPTAPSWQQPGAVPQQGPLPSLSPASPAWAPRRGPHPPAEARP